MTDISVDLGGFRFNLRVGAVVSRREEVLVCRIDTENWWFLPGGRIKTNETSSVALTRELQEEIGMDFHILRPIVCAENFFTEHGISFHEICFFYEVEWFGDHVSAMRDNQFFAWVPKTALKDLDLRPAFIKQYIVYPPSTLEWVINMDKES